MGHVTRRGQRLFGGGCVLAICACCLAQEVAFDPFAGTETSGTAKTPSPESRPAGAATTPQSGRTLPAPRIDEGPVLPPVKMDKADISDIFDILSDAAGWNVLASPKVTTTKVSLWLTNITARQLLEHVTAIHGFVYEQQGNVIAVMTFEEYAQLYGLVKKTITLKHASVDAIAAALTQFVSKRGKMSTYPDANALVVYESDSNLPLLERVVLAFLARRDGHGADPEDLAQEAFLQAFQHPQRYRSESTPRTYFLGIAANLLRDEAKARRREQAQREPPEPLDDDCPYCDEECRLTRPEAALCRAERQAALEHAILELPPKERDAAELTMLHGLNAAGAATKAGSSVKTLRDRLFRAIPRLRRRLAGEY